MPTFNLADEKRLDKLRAKGAFKAVLMDPHDRPVGMCYVKGRRVYADPDTLSETNAGPGTFLARLSEADRHVVFFRRFARGGVKQ